MMNLLKRIARKILEDQLSKMWEEQIVYMKDADYYKDQASYYKKLSEKFYKHNDNLPLDIEMRVLNVQIVMPYANEGGELIMDKEDWEIEKKRRIMSEISRFLHKNYDQIIKEISVGREMNRFDEFAVKVEMYVGVRKGGEVR